MKKSSTFRRRIFKLFHLMACMAAVTLAASRVTFAGENDKDKDDKNEKKAEAASAKHLPKGSWRFIVAGDSRNCGDVVMPAIAAHSAQFAPAFYWHLGDLRAIYKIDEDMAYAARYDEHPLTCAEYHKIAWPDFIENQIGAFGSTPFYLGIGNHEVIPPKTEDEFKSVFAHWLDLPALKDERAKDGETAAPEAYYHWIQGGVDFIYLDNASGVFSPQQIAWLQKRLDGAKTNPEVKSLVVGMHEALPGSLSNSHSMGDKGPGSPGYTTGSDAYNRIVKFRDDTKKPVYVLASHSHFYMDHIFDPPADAATVAKPPLSGWIVGTAGAVRYVLPEDSRPSAVTDVYGFLLATVYPDGRIQFKFEEVHESDVPENVRQRYTNATIPWCFAHNSQNRDSKKDVTLDCPVE